MTATAATGSAAGVAASATGAAGVRSTAAGVTAAALVVIAAGAGAAGDAAWVRGAALAVWGAAAAALVVRRPAEPLGRLLLAGSGLAAGGHLAAAFAEGGVGDAAGRAVLALLPGVAVHLLLAVPDGRLPTAADRRLTVASYAACAAGVAAVVLDESFRWVVPVIAAALLAVALPRSNVRYRAAGSADRRRLQWFGWGVAVAAEVVLVVTILELLVDWPGHAAEIATAVLALPALALVAGTSPRLTGRVDRLLTHTVDVAGVTALVLAVDVVVVASLNRVPRGGERSVLLLAMAATAVAAVLHRPVRDRLTAATNRLVYGERVAPDETLRTFGQRLTRAVPLDELLLQLAESLKRTLGVASAEVWTVGPAGLELTVAVPRRDRAPVALGAKEAAVVARAGAAGGTWLDVWLPGLVADRQSELVRVAPLAHAGELLGLLVTERRPDTEPLSEEDDRVVVELARQVGLALHNAHLDSALQSSLDELQRANEELRASRARIVAAGDAERRRLERDLHDGAQQHLVAMSVKLRLLGDALDDDPDDARVLLGQLRDDIKEATQELRNLAHGIFPPLLASDGLPEALAAAANRSPLPAVVVAEGVGRYESEVEAAVYFCCLEAMQNAAKHAGESATIEIVVRDDGDGLEFAVRDDGAGFDAAAGQGGHGFVNMRDRLGAIDGHLSVTSAPGEGTTVRGTVPLRSR